MHLAGLILARQDAPPMPTPPGQVPPNRYPQIFGFIGAFLPLATITLALRLFSRRKFSYLGADDISIMLSYVSFLAGNIVTVIATKYGLGIHIWDVNYPETGIPLQKCAFISQVLYPMGLGFAKLSILLFLIRIVPSASLWRKCVWAIAAFVVCEEVVITIVLILQCRPISFFWDKMMDPPGKCINTAFFYVDASLNIATDLVILSLPWFIFSSLQIPKRKKYALLAICSVGCFTLITSIMRIPFLMAPSKSQDPTWDIVNLSTWSIAEVGSALTTASVPTLRPLVAWIYPRFMSSTRSGASKSNSSANLGRKAPDRGSSVMLSTIGGGKQGSGQARSWFEIESGNSDDGQNGDEGRIGDDKSEEYVLNDDGRVVVKQTPTIKKTVSKETLLR